MLMSIYIMGRWCGKKKIVSGGVGRKTEKGRKSQELGQG